MRSFYFCACLLIWRAAFGATTVQVEPLTFEVGSWPPLIDFSRADKGSLSQIVAEVFAKTGKEIHLTEVSWKSAEAHLDEGSTVSFGWIRTSERGLRWHYSQPICTTLTVLVRRSDHPSLRLPEDILGKRVGWSRGYSYGERFDALRPQLHVKEMPNDETGLRHLLTGTIDFMPMDTIVAKSLIAKHLTVGDGRQLVVDTSPAHIVVKTPLHLVCPRSRTECEDIIASFDRGLSGVRSSVRANACGD
jgi:ABC-type amino acid transport substrate-binding protein